MIERYSHFLFFTLNLTVTSTSLRPQLQCSYRQVYMLERCRHTLCLLCLYAHVSETLKEVLKKIEEKQPMGEGGETKRSTSAGEGAR